MYKFKTFEVNKYNNVFYTNDKNDGIYLKANNRCVVSNNNDNSLLSRIPVSYKNLALAKLNGNKKNSDEEEFSFKLVEDDYLPF